MEHTRGGVRTTDPWTSHAAASSINATRLESMVYQVIYRYGRKGCISDEIRSDLGLDNNSITPRFAPLRRKKLIADTGYAKPGNSGRQQTIWITMEFLEDWMEDHKDEL